MLLLCVRHLPFFYFFRVSSQGTTSHVEVLCPPGTYGTAPGATTFDTCVPCPDGSLCLGGSEAPHVSKTWRHKSRGYILTIVAADVEGHGTARHGEEMLFDEELMLSC